LRKKCIIAREIKHWFIFPLIIFLSPSFFILNEENTFLYRSSENLILNSNDLYHDFKNINNLNLNESTTQNKYSSDELLGVKNTSTKLITIDSPSPPNISRVPQEVEIQWGMENISLIWEIYGGENWTIWRNDTILKNGMMCGNLIELKIENWQIEGWKIGVYNLTLKITDSIGSSSCKTTWVKIWANLGDRYVNTVVTESSLWYSSGERAIGAPNNKFAIIFFDYGNGYITLDMGKNEEIFNGEGDDFKIIAQGGEYSILVSNNLSQMFRFLGLGTGNKSFDISSIDLSIVRYIRIEYRSGDDIELDGVVATNYNQPESDTIAPVIIGIQDFWVWENQTLVTLHWQVSDTTPWNYSISVNGEVVEKNPWNGSDVTYIISPSVIGVINVTIILCDVFGNRAEDFISIEIRMIVKENNFPTQKNTHYSTTFLLLGLIIFIFYKKKVSSVIRKNKNL